MFYKNLTINEKINVRSRFGIGYNEHEKEFILKCIYEVPECCFSSPNKFYWRNV